MNIRYAVLSAGLLAAAVAQAHAQAVQMRFTPRVGMVTHYRMASRMWSSADTSAAPTMQSTMYQTETVLPPDAGNSIVRTVWDSTVMGGSAAGGRDMMRGMAVTVTMDPSGHVVSTQVTPPPGLPAFLGNMLTKNAGANDSPRRRVWPEGSISPGYTWTDSMVITSGSGRSQKRVTFHVTYKYERLEHQAGDRVVVVSMNGAPPSGETGTLTGEMSVDIDAGRLTHLVTDMVQAQSRVRSMMDMLP
jgi:hypothetical protein